MTPRESLWFDSSKAQKPDGWRVASSQAQFSTIKVNNHDIGLLFLPKLPLGQALPPRYMLDSVARRAKSLREKTDLVIAISPWGFLAEKKLLDLSEPTVDILLGSGPGPGIAGRFEAHGKTFWMRAYTKGRAVHVLHILSLPDRTSEEWRWVHQENLLLDLKPLRESIAADDGMGLTLRKLFPDAR